MAWQESLYSGKATPDESGHCPREDEKPEITGGSLPASQRITETGSRSSDPSISLRLVFQDACGIASGGHQR